MFPRLHLRVSARNVPGRARAGGGEVRDNVINVNIFYIIISGTRIWFLIIKVKDLHLFCIVNISRYSTKKLTLKLDKKALYQPIGLSLC